MHVEVDTEVLRSLITPVTDKPEHGPSQRYPADLEAAVGPAAGALATPTGPRRAGLGLLGGSEERSLRTWVHAHPRVRHEAGRIHRERTLMGAAAEHDQRVTRPGAPGAPVVC